MAGSKILRRMERLDMAWSIKLDLLPSLPRRRYPHSRDDQTARNVSVPIECEKRKQGRVVLYP
jgi:hypothetical protein